MPLLVIRGLSIFSELTVIAESKRAYGSASMTTYEFTYLKCLELCFVHFLMLAVVIFFLIFMKKAIIYIFKKCVYASV